MKTKNLLYLEREKNMKSDTGVVRRIDDLGRVVIPKEMRHALQIKECEPLELFCDSERQQIVIKKYDEEKSINYQELWFDLKRHFPEFSEVMKRFEEKRSTNG